MKIILILFSALFAIVSQVYAQKELPEICINSSVTIHILSPEPIQYVDIASSSLAGDLPMKNLLRLKVLPDSAFRFSRTSGTIATIVGESFIAQYLLRYENTFHGNLITTQIDILPEHMHPLEVPGVSLTSNSIRQQALNILSQKISHPLIKDRANGMQSFLNNVYTLGNYIFLDISFRNVTNLPYTIDEIRFTIEDKKITKATNIQSVEVKPEFTLFNKSSFKKNYRNVFVFRRFNYPGNKQLSIALSEKQISGRAINIKVPYRDILDADIVPIIK